MEPLWTRVEELFNCALQKPESERDAWLASQTGLDPLLQTEVQSLLDADRRHEELNAQAPAHRCDSVAGVDAGGEFLERGQRFGPYQTERLLGRGGMGAVYLARRADGQFDQTVALKVMAAYLAGEEFVNRFRNERQLLATLTHPNITRLLDGGVAAGGDPYLVMEYIEGQPLDEYCDHRRLPVEARIRLFLQVCEAVEFAHRNLIVHGDLKPANILVTAEGTVKLLDFGTAKVLRYPGGKVTQFALMTPRYASPEQLRGDLINTQSDLFSLGVILYELLTGTWPFGDPKSPADGMDRVLRGRGPNTPPRVVTVAAAENRSVSPDRLRHHLTGDLSTILLKMLDTDPGQRYGSVREAKEDLELFRQGRPVRARPHSAWYVTRKFVRRNRLAVFAAGLSVVALAGLAVVSVYASAQAQAQAARAERVSEFAKNTFLSASTFWASPLRGKRDAIQFSDILDNASDRVGKELGNDPEAEAGLRDTLGITYAMLGEPAKGETQLTLGLQVLPRIRGGAPAIAASLYLDLCDARSFQGRYPSALTACRAAVAICRVSAPDRLGGALHDTAFMAVNAGEPLAEVAGMYREALRYPRPNQTSFPAIVNSRIGLLRLRQGDLYGGESILLEAEQVLRGSAEPPVEIVPVLYARAFASDVRGHYPEAAGLMKEALDIVTRRRVWFMEPDERALQLSAYEALAGNGRALGRLRDVEQRLSYSSGAPVDQIRHHLFSGIVESRGGSRATAEWHLRAALSVQKREMNRQPDLSVEICVRLMELLESSGRPKEAAAAARQGLRDAAIAYGGFFNAHPFVIEMQKHLH